jgi:hypothetical protein
VRRLIFYGDLWRIMVVLVAGGLLVWEAIR